MSARRALNIVGRSLIVLGVLVLLFVVYTLWGTGIQEARSQSSLRSAFAKSLTSGAGRTATSVVASGGKGGTTRPVAGASRTTVAPTTVAPTTEPPTTVAPPPADIEGQPFARIEIPKIGLNKVVVSGVSLGDLQKGPGHYPGTALPGHLGNTAIAGHRTTYGAPFYRVNELSPGDEIRVTTTQGTFRYVVTGIQIVDPHESSVLDPTPQASLTLTSCHPRYSAAQRIIVTANLDTSATPPIRDPSSTAPASNGATATTTGQNGAASNQSNADTVDATTIAGAEGEDSAHTGIDGLGGGWFASPGAVWPALFFGLLTAAFCVAAVQLARRTGVALACYAGAFPFVIVGLYFFFENVARLLPANI